MLRWLGMTALGLTEQNPKYRVSTSPSLTARSEADIDVKAFKSMLFFPFESLSEVHLSFKKIVDDFKGRVAKQQAKLFLAEDAHRNFIAIRPAGAPHDDIHEHHWVPKILLDSGMVPEALGGHGHCWLLSGRELGYFGGFGNMPFAGFPTILVGLKGSWVVCTWPMTAQVAAGGKVTDFNALIEGMKPMEVVTFMEKIELALLTAGNNAIACTSLRVDVNRTKWIHRSSQLVRVWPRCRAQ